MCERLRERKSQKDKKRPKIKGGAGSERERAYARMGGKEKGAGAQGVE